MWNWVKSHPVTIIIILIDLIVSIVENVVSEKISFSKKNLNVFGDSDLGLLFFSIKLMLLFSGIEPSVGRIKFGIWMIWNYLFIFAFQLIFGYDGHGPSFVIFSLFLTFVCIHKPYLIFKFLRINFPDTYLYVAAVLQYTFFCKTFCLDLFGILISNLIFHILIKTMKKIRSFCKPHEIPFIQLENSEQLDDT